MLSPARAFISSGGSVTYHVEGYAAAGNPLGDLTAQTTFSIRFSAAKTSHRIRPDGSCTGATCTAAKYGRHTVIATVNLGNRIVSVTAALQVVPRPHAPHGTTDDGTTDDGTTDDGTTDDGTTDDGTTDDGTTDAGTTDDDTTDAGTTDDGTTDAGTTDDDTTDAGTTDQAVIDKVSGGGTDTQTSCVPSATDVRRFEVAPSKATPGAQVQVTAQITRKFGTCSVRIFLVGSQFGGDATVGPDGNLSVQRTVPNDAKPGITPVRLATTSGRTLATVSFEVLPKTEAAVVPAAGGGLPWLLLLLLLLLLAVPAVLQERNRRQRRWVHKHFRAEPHPSADDISSLDQDPESEPSFSFRLQAHGDAGTQTLKEGN